MIGTSAATILHCGSQSLFAAYRSTLAVPAARQGRFPGERSTIASAGSGFSHIIEATQTHDLDTGVLRSMKAVIDRATATGQDGFAPLVHVLRPGLAP